MTASKDAPANDRFSGLTAKWQARWHHWITSGDALTAAPALCAVFTIFALAICFGGVDAWSFSVGAVGLGMALILLARNVSKDFKGHSPNLLMILGSFVYIAVLAFVYLQSTPGLGLLPQHPIWRFAEQTLRIPLTKSVSIAPDATQSGLLWLAFYGVFFWALWWPCRNAAVATLATRVFLGLECALAFYGALVFSTGNKTVGFVERVSYVNSLTATFVNKNSYATFVGIGVIVSFTILARRLTRDMSQTTNVSEKIQLLIIGLFRRHLGLLFIFSMLLLVLASSQSRAGLASTFIGLGVVLLALTLRNRNKLGLLVGLMLALGLSAYAVMNIGGDDLTNRFERIEGEAANRGAIYHAALQAAIDSPPAGTGLGSFQYTFYNYITRDLISTASYYAAHNTYLENMIELGWPATVAINLCLLLLIILCWRGVLRRRRDYEFCLAAIGVSAQVAAHSLFDFSLQIPAVTCAYLFVLATGVAQSVSSSSRAG